MRLHICVCLSEKFSTRDAFRQFFEYNICNTLSTMPTFFYDYWRYAAITEIFISTTIDDSFFGSDRLSTFTVIFFELNWAALFICETCCPVEHLYKKNAYRASSFAILIWCAIIYVNLTTGSFIRIYITERSKSWEMQILISVLNDLPTGCVQWIYMLNFNMIYHPEILSHNFVLIRFFRWWSKSNCGLYDILSTSLTTRLE